MIDLFGLPLSSTALFLLAGILIGHLLWYRDRSADSQQMNGLEDRYAKARGSARQRKNDAQRLQKLSDSQADELASLQQHYETLQGKTARLEQTHESTVVELNQLKRKHEKASANLNAEKKRAESVIAQMQEVLESKTALELETQDRREAVHELSKQKQHTHLLIWKRHDVSWNRSVTQRERINNKLVSCRLISYSKRSRSRIFDRPLNGAAMNPMNYDRNWK